MTPVSDVIESREAHLMAETVQVTAAYKCDFCACINVAVHDSKWPSGISKADWLEKMDSRLHWEPSRRIGREFPDVPDHVAGAASEAHECLGIGAFRAAVLLARAVIEATAKDRGVTQGRLTEKIDAMFDKGLLREHVKDGAHEVRHLGNDMAHGDFVAPVAAEEAEEVVGLMGEVLEEVYQSPARVARLREARRVKKAGGGAAGS